MDKCDRVCAYCGKHEVKARGLCNACYIRLQRNGDCKYKRRKTNADKIRASSDEELADWLIMNGNGSDYQTWLDWLREEVKE